MMSWISEWANKAEHLLNTLDSSAAEAFNANRGRIPTSVFDNTASARSELPQVVKELDFSSPNWDQFAHDPNTSSSAQYLSESVPGFSTQKHAASKLRSSPKLSMSPLKSTNVSDIHLDEILGDSGRTAESLSLSESGHVGNEEAASSSGYETVDSVRLPSVGVENQSCRPISVREADTKHLTPVRAILAQETVTDTKLENKLLRSEVSSMSQEVSGLLKRNHKAVEENKELRGQVERLTNQLRDSDTRVRELQVRMKEFSIDYTSRATMDQDFAQMKQQLTIAQADLLTARGQLESSKKHAEAVESSLQEARRQNEIAEKRAELAQKESSRLIKELAQYKEKAAHILTMKENLISSLRAADANSMSPNETSDVDREMMESLQAECDMLREEVSRWRIEADHRELAMQELEVQMQSERESLRRDHDLAEQHAQRERQLREDADSELVQLKRQLREYENSMSRQKADWHAQLTASETELGRLRQTLARRHSSGTGHFLVDSSPTAELTRTDPEHVLSLESRLRQLSDNLLTKQDVLDSVLAQNHALKIRLERAHLDNESLASALSAPGDNQSDIYVRLPYQAGTYGCARLALHNSPIPRSVRPIPRFLDDMGIRLTNLLRRWPLARLLFFVYTAFLHLWLLWATLVYLPPTQPLS